MVKSLLTIGMSCVLIGCMAGGYVLAANPTPGVGHLMIDLAQPQIEMSSDLYGVFFEDINHGADGGLYAEMVRNRSFEFNTSDQAGMNGLTAWRLVQRGDGVATLKIHNQEPLNERNLNYARININQPGTGVGIMNTGYNNGFNVVAGSQYNISFYARRSDSHDVPVTIALESVMGTIYGQATVVVTSDKWQQYKATITTSDSSNGAQLVITTTGIGHIDFDMVSVFPKDTFMGRGNGLRTDVALMLANLQPAFFRFPGGCIVHAGSYREDAPYRVYRWKDTIGDVAQRPVSASMWAGNNQSFGLGFYEYFLFAEDIGATPVPHITAGIDPHAVPGERGAWYHVPLSQMQPWIDNALDLIEFANGDDSTYWGAKRAELGHPEPFNLRYIGIGNEDINREYADRFAMFQQAIKEKYPEILIISSSGPFSQGNEFNYGWAFSQQMNADIVDEHYYNDPTWFFNNTTRYDDYDRTGPKVFIGEYASKGNTFYNALAEAAFMTGIERNSDIVAMASYAPLLANVDYINWTPDLIWLNNHQVYGTPNYYVQKLFALNKGDAVLASSYTGEIGDIAAFEPISGGIGLGTWATQAKFDNVQVINNLTGETLFEDDFSNDLSQWSRQSGAWRIHDGTTAQTGTGEDARLVAGNPHWSNYTISLTATKTSGNEAFLILFGNKNTGDYFWWNIGGWGNTQHAIEKAVNGSRSVVTSKAAAPIKTGQEYDIKIVIEGRQIRCYLDGVLIHDYNDGPGKIDPLFYVVTQEQATGDVIVKAVNPHPSPMQTRIEIAGVKEIATDGVMTTLTAKSLDATNSFMTPENVVPMETTVTGFGTDFEYTFAGYSLTILRLQTK